MGNGLLNLDFGSIIGSVGDIVDDLHTSPEEMAAADRADRELDLKRDLGQMEINKVEAQHKNVFVAGWRPFIGWVGGFALAWKFIVHPIAEWIIVILQAFEKIAPEIAPLPSVDATELYPIIMGMLGMGALRTYDKLKNIDTRKLLRGGM